MRKNIFCMFAIALLLCSHANSQQVLLPFGQSTKQPWSASCYFAPDGEEGPSQDWYKVDFDDSEWGTTQGPISTDGSLQYYATEWQEHYSTYWVRRHFTIDDISDYSFFYLYICHDDGCEIFLNGTQIYNDDNYYSQTVTILFTEEMRSLLVKGDNVIAVKVHEYSGDAFMDFGIEAYRTALLSNPDFDNGWEGWKFNGEGFSHGGQDFNYVMRNLSKKPFDVSQTVKGAKKGLYRLRAQAFEAYNESESGWKNYHITPVYAYLYINKSKHIIKNVFDDALISNIYLSNEYYRTPDDTYIPTWISSVSIAFQQELYENEFYAYIDTAEFNIGISFPEEVDMERWTVFDNFRLDYISENRLADLITEMESLSKLPMEKDNKASITTLVSELKSAKDYESRCNILTTYSDCYVNARKSSEQYALIDETIGSLQEKLDNETGTFTSDATIEEVKDMIGSTKKRFAEGDITALEVQKLINKLEKLEERLGYTFINIVDNKPGSIGDSILDKVEYFADVQSLKISGTLNDADLTTIRNRLTQLREIDMTDVDMVEMPDELFYDHTLLEIVKLPAFLESIGNRAFYQCYGIRQIDFPSTLTTIKESAFRECDNLQEVIIPEGVISVGNYAFFSCDGNKHVKLPSTLESIGYSVFQYNIRLEKVDFAEGLTHIEDMAFYECYALDNVKFPKSLYHIGNSAFAYNRSLSSIVFNEGLFQIEDNAFYDCDALTEVVLPSTLVLAYASPFDYCDNLMKVTCLSIEPPYMQDQIPYPLSMDGRELYVPALSINTYKQTSGWDKFQTIKPIDYLPENISVLSDMKLTLPETIPASYKPNVSIIHDLKGTSTWQYGSLTVNGEGTLSISDFSMFWDPNCQYVQNNNSKSYCTLITNSHIRADNVSIDLWPRNNIWTFISLPFDVKVSDILTFADGATNWVIRKYDGQKRANGETAETWLKLTSDDILNAYEGYIIQGSRYVDGYRQEGSGFRMKAINNANKNNIFQTNDITIQLKEYESEFVHNRSWNLVGNPYPCYYDTRFMDFEAPITVWNMRNSTYEAYSPSDDSYILSPGEAFFVQRPIENGSIVFSKDGRQTTSEARNINKRSLAPGRTDETGSLGRKIININITDGTTCDRTRIVLNNKAQMQYEMDKDASKFMSTDASVPQLFTIAENVKYSINERPYNEEATSLGVRIGSNGIFTISMNEKIEGYNIILEDKAEDKRVVLSDVKEYTFNANEGEYTNRFSLYFIDGTTVVKTTNSDNTGNETDIYSTGGVKVNVTSSKDVYIQDGKKMLFNK